VLAVAASVLFLMHGQSRTEVFTKSANDANSATKQTTEQTSSQPTEVTFLAMGDIMLSRNVAGQMNKNNKDPQWPFAHLQSELHSADFNFANLESPFSGSDDFPSTGSLIFNAPTWTLPGLVKNNFQVLNLANNHAFDQSKAGLLYTKKLLGDAGITT